MTQFRKQRKAVLYQVLDRDGNIIAEDIAKRLADKFYCSEHNIYDSAIKGGLIMSKYRVIKTNKYYEEVMEVKPKPTISAKKPKFEELVDRHEQILNEHGNVLIFAPKSQEQQVIDELINRGYRLIVKREKDIRSPIVWKCSAL